MKVNYSLVFFIGHYLNLIIRSGNVVIHDENSEVKFTNNLYVWRHLLIDVWDNSTDGARNSHIKFIQMVIDEVHVSNTHRAFQEADVYRPVRELCLRLEGDLRTLLSAKLLGEITVTGVELNNLLSQWLVDMAAINDN